MEVDEWYGAETKSKKRVSSGGFLSHRISLLKKKKSDNTPTTHL